MWTKLERFRHHGGEVRQMPQVPAANSDSCCRGRSRGRNYVETKLASEGNQAVASRNATKPTRRDGRFARRSRPRSKGGNLLPPLRSALQARDRAMHSLWLQFFGRDQGRGAQSCRKKRIWEQKPKRSSRNDGSGSIDSNQNVE